ncbi:TRAP transporter fused permease subunit [Zobellella aerophila]|uniref:TRAP C4-dicarboxylate transport system permease DctM subunit domain-containing protein n=1 Tax=Zobellella aerophila TaxID=870480 RepID=A0ABP6W2L0_9GAMM
MHSVSKNAADIIIRGLEGLILFGGAGIALYHFIYVFTTLQGSTEHYITHITFGVILCALTPMLKTLKSERTRHKKVVATLALATVLLLGTAALLYMRFYARDLEDFFPYFEPHQLPIGIMAIATILIMTWVHWGPTLPLLTLVAILYFFLGHLIPSEGVFMALNHAEFDPYYVMGYLGLSPTQGFIGWIIPVSANFIFLFVIFGNILLRTGVVEMFLELGRAIGNVLKPGPAYAATLASAMVGTVTGAPGANVVLTGSVTIPAMKAVGFKGHHAAAVEACASTGGQIMPPVMGAAVFIMAAFINLPYIEIAQRALVPALLYFTAVAVGIYFLVKSLGINPPKVQVSHLMIWRRLPCFFIPLGLIVALLIQRYSPMYAATLGTLALLAVSAVLPETRISFKKLVQALSEGAVQGAQIAMVLSCVGMFSQVVITTGLGAKLGEFVIGLTDGTLLPTLLAAMVICILLGMSVPTVPAYVLTALAVGPTLVGLGVDVLGAHLFVFYFAIFSTLTPPIAMASIVAARIADAGFMRTSLEGLRLSLVGYFIPFAFIFHPALLNFPNIGMEGTIALASTLLVCVTYSAASYGAFGTHLSTPLRFLFAAATLVGGLYLLGYGSMALTGQLLLSLLSMAIAVWRHRKCPLPATA